MATAQPTAWLMDTSHMAKQISRFDWSKTPLEGMGGWPPALRTLVRTILDSPLPTIFGWGSELTAIYNDAYRELLGDKHPEALGHGFLDIWSEAEPIIGPLVERVWKGEACRFENAHFELRRNGSPEEAWFDYSFSPLRDDDGRVCGLLNMAVETTAQVQTLRQREENENLFRESFFANPDFMLLLDLESDVLVEVNEAACRTTGHPREHLLGRTPVELHLIAPEEYRRLKAAVRDQGEIRDTHIALRHPDGEIRQVVYSLKAVRMRNRDRAIISGQDLTLRLRMEKELSRTTQRLERLLSTMPAAAYTCDAEGRITFHNHEAVRLWGRRPAPNSPEERYCGAFRLFSTDGEPIADADSPMAAVVHGAHGIRNQEVIIERPDGSRSYVSANIAPLYDEDGHRCGAINIFTDITRLKVLENTLRENEQSLLALFRAVPDALVVIELSSGRIRDANHAYRRLLEYGMEDLVGRTALDLDIWADIDDRGKVRSALKAGRRVKDYEARLKTGKGRIVEVLLSAETILLGEKLFVMCVIKDITPRKRAEDELRRSWETINRQNEELRLSEALLRKAHEEAARANRAKSEFLASMSHEIRTPMNGVIGMLELSLLASPGGKLKEYLELSKKAATNLLDIINDVLDLSKIEAGKMELKPRPFAPRPLVEGVLDTLAAPAGDKGLALRHFIEPDIPDRLLGDEVRLRQILLNLVGNAVKFTENGHILISVEDAGRTGSDGARLRFTVRDTGIGISPDRLEDIFESFSQEEKITPAKHGGTGLGLTISRRLAAMMGGELEVESTPGKGSTFTFTALFDPAPGDTEDRVADEDGDSTEFSSLRVLIAEDNPVNRIFLSELLDHFGCAVTESENGREALDRLRESSFDAVIMDVQMPELDGVETTRRIRSGDEPGIPNDIPIIALTAYALKGDRERFLAEGMDEYLTKPVKLDALKATLRQVLRR